MLKANNDTCSDVSLCAATTDDAPHAIKEISQLPALLKAAQTFSICEAAGIPCLIGSMPETGIGTAAQIHLGVAMTNLKFDSDACGVRYFSEDCLMQPLKIENGYAYPPEGVGLGIDVDEAILSRWQADAE